MSKNEHCSTEGDLDPEVLAIMRDHARNQRAYAAGNLWGYGKGSEERRMMERGLVEELIAAAPNEFDFPGPIVVTSQEDDPPDCVVEAEGVRIGVEVTELVDEDYVMRAEQEKKRGVQFDNFSVWNRKKFLAWLTDRITKKGHPRDMFGGPFSEYFLLFHTAEIGLSIEEIEKWLEAVPPISSGVATRGYLMFDYHPDRGRAVVRLPLRPRDGG